MNINNPRSRDLIDIDPLITEPCEYEFTHELNVQCGYYTTTGYSGIQYKLPFVVINGEELASNRANPHHKTALLALQGGPGSSAGIDNRAIYSWMGWYQRQKIKMPMVLFDYRSTGSSNPLYQCQGFLNSRQGNEEKAYQNSFEAFKTCLTMIKHAGAHELDFSSKTTAKDAITLAKRLGFEAINIYGNSFGTRVALWAAKLSPDYVNYMVLDALHTPTNGDMNQWPQRYVGAFKQYFSFCNRHGLCDVNEEKLFQALTVVTNSKKIIDGSAEQLLEVLYSNLYFKEGYRLNNDLIDRVLQFDAQNVSNKIKTVKPEDRARVYSSNQSLNFNKFIHVLTNCVDNPLVQIEQFERSKLLFPHWNNLLSYDAATDVCFLVKTNNQMDSEDWRSISVNTLILSGELDPVTSYQSVTSFYPSFKNAVHLSRFDGGHGMIDSEPCLSGLISHYISGYNVRRFLEQQCDFNNYNLTQ